MGFAGGLRERLGGFWWHSLVIFCALRASDALNAFAGVWLVPKYIDPAELGAVMPLTNFAVFLALPATVFANTFRSELSRLALAGDYGRMKSLMRGVFCAAGAFLAIALAASRFVLPAFLGRIRIVEGSLGLLILLSAFLGAVHPVFNYSLQALKKFNANAAIGALGAPARCIAMVVAMPFRAISGYFVGQCATPAFNIAATVFCLRKELSVPAERYWTREVAKRFSRLAALFAAAAFSGMAASLVESTVLRHNLPDLDSAGYYMASRFAEIATFATSTLTFTIFPYAAELAAAGKRTDGLVLKAAAAAAAFGAAVATPFFFFGGDILALLPNGADYAPYGRFIPPLIGIGCMWSFACIYTTAEISAGRFGYLKWMVPLELAYPAALLASGGPRSLHGMVCWMAAFNAAKAMFCAAAIFVGNRTSRKGKRKNGNQRIAADT